MAEDEGVLDLGSLVGKQQDAGYAPWRKTASSLPASIANAIAATGVFKGGKGRGAGRGGGRGGGDDNLPPAMTNRFLSRADEEHGGRGRGARGPDRYYGEETQMRVLRKKEFRKVCWGCGLGEHERYECPNLIAQSPPLVILDRKVGHRAQPFAPTLIRTWRPEHACLGKDVSAVSCIVCKREGDVDCCSLGPGKKRRVPKSCIRCGLDHWSDDCGLLQGGTDWHGNRTPPSPSPQGGWGSGGSESPPYSPVPSSEPWPRPPGRGCALLGPLPPPQGGSLAVKLSEQVRHQMPPPDNRGPPSSFPTVPHVAVPPPPPNRQGKGGYHHFQPPPQQPGWGGGGRGNSGWGG
eukprot:Hpha_TRINITY_DN15912_c2_g2::TRINITY_DN15912_c2_g2_i1::g.70863::m.70863